MAAEKADGPCVKCYVAFALTIMIVLVATGVWNPFPAVWDWVNRSQPLSTSNVVWQQRLGGTPKSVTIADGAVVVEHSTSVEARSLASGAQIWQRKADWAAVAGGEQDPVVVVGELLVKGYEVLDPASGAVRRRDKAAVAVWSYRNGLLDVRCFAPRDCTLTAWDPRGEAPLWSTELPGIGFVLFADNPDVLDTVPLTSPQVAPDAGGPQLMPGLIGFPINGRVHIVDTANGRKLQDLQPDRETRIAVVGGRMLRVVARSQDGTCYFTIDGQDAATGQPVWRQTGINLRTADGAGCPQRKDPAGGQSVIVGVGPDMREVVLDAYDGRQLWRGAEREKLVAVDDHFALARAPDGKSIKGYELGVARPGWSRGVHEKGEGGLTRYAALIVDHQPDRIIALNPSTGREQVNIRSSAKVLAVGSQGMVIGEGRDIAYIRFGGASGPDAGSGVPGPGQGSPGNGGPGNGPGGDNLPCDGPKEPRCQTENGRG